MSVTRILRNSGAKLTHTFYADGAAITADATVTVAITKADGSALTAGNASLVGSTYEFVLPAQSALNRLTVTWAGTFSGVAQSQVDTVEIVGGFYAATAQIRALKNLDSTTTYPAAKLVDARTWFEDRFEGPQATNVAWVRRFRRVELRGDGTNELVLPDLMVREVLSLTVRDAGASTWTAFTAAELADLEVDSAGTLTRLSLGTFPARRRVVIEYEHGYDQPPADVAEAALVAIRDKLVNDNSGTSATRQPYAVQSGDIVERFSTPGRNRPFGVPFVDSVVNDRSHRVPAVG